MVKTCQTQFCMVISRNGKELRRNDGVRFDVALKQAQQFNNNNQDKTWNCETAYVEETKAIRHLPIIGKTYSS